MRSGAQQNGQTGLVGLGVRLAIALRHKTTFGLQQTCKTLLARQIDLALASVADKVRQSLQHLFTRLHRRHSSAPDVVQTLSIEDTKPRAVRDTRANRHDCLVFRQRKRLEDDLQRLLSVPEKLFLHQKRRRSGAEGTRFSNGGHKAPLLRHQSPQLVEQLSVRGVTRRQSTRELDDGKFSLQPLGRHLNLERRHLVLVNVHGLCLGVLIVIVVADLSSLQLAIRSTISLTHAAEESQNRRPQVDRTNDPSKWDLRLRTLLSLPIFLKSVDDSSRTSVWVGFEHSAGTWDDALKSPV